MIDFTEIPSSQIPPASGFAPIREYSEIYTFLETYFYKLGYEYHRAFKTSATLSSKENNLAKFTQELLSILETNLKESLKEHSKENSETPQILNEYFAILKKLLKILDYNKIKLDEKILSSTLLGYLITKLK